MVSPTFTPYQHNEHSQLETSARLRPEDKEVVIACVKVVTTKGFQNMKEFQHMPSQYSKLPFCAEMELIQVCLSKTTRIVQVAASTRAKSRVRTFPMTPAGVLIRRAPLPQTSGTSDLRPGRCLPPTFASSASGVA